jgi:hypothetical protein
LYIDLKEGIQLAVASALGATHSIFHGVEGVLGGVQKGIVEIPEIVSFDPLDFFSLDVLDSRVK